jgi:hypothetical protein
VVQELAFCVAVGSIGNGTADLSDLATHLSEFKEHWAGYLGSHDSDVLLAATVAWIVQQNAEERDNLPRLPRLPFLINILNGEISATDILIDLPHAGQEFPRRYNYQPSWPWWYQDNARRIFTDHADSEWIGYYTYRSENGSGWASQRMWGIRFVDHEEWKGEFGRGDLWRIETNSGADSTGPFRFKGEYKSDEDHEVDIFKTNHARWDMHGSFTPLGLVGRWEEGPWDSPTGKGFIWIYKREWLEKEQVVFADKASPG